MKMIKVLYEDKIFYWVDTVQYEYSTLAVLVYPQNGRVFRANVAEIKVVDVDSIK